ncbi:hypothetical protein [Methylobacterium sp. V23]|uniref:hypothetical protein n=1 Tax=Methylobacterium sp. V23 TaxID=2044878 RepID=UPI0015E1867C|nr:hypothetical protein [Methylobacterium sp. V23]
MIAVLGLWAAYWAALFAQVAHLRSLEDGVGALAFSWVSRTLLAIGTALFLLAKTG